MRRGVSYYATAPCLAPPALPAATLLRTAWRQVQSARQMLIAAGLAALLALSPPIGVSAVKASASPITAQAAPQSYSAWSCRGVYHVVRRGETLYSIARRYGTTAYRIAVCNGLSSYTVYVGQTLLVPMGR